jgi:hypothetical protein
VISRALSGLALAGLVLAAASFTAIGAPPAAAGAGSYYLSPGQSLSVNQYIRSEGFGLVLQYDGNLVLYKHFQGSGGTQTACWATGTTHHPGPYVRKLVMQQDGNLVLYLYSGGPVEWASGTNDSNHYGKSAYIDRVGVIGGTRHALGIGSLPFNGDFDPISSLC